MIVVAALILDTRGRALMARRSLTDACPGLWEYPGGKTEPGETLEQAVEREMEEELGVYVRATRRVSRLTLDYGRGPFTFHLLECELVSGVPIALEGQPEVDWVSPQHAVAALACCPTTYLCQPDVAVLASKAIR